MPTNTPIQGEPLSEPENSEQKHGVNKGHKWKKGQSGNPNGRPPKGYSITEEFKAMLGAEPKLKRKIIQSIKDKAIKGDMNAAKLIWEYMDGKPKQAVEHTGEEGGPIVIVTKVPNADD